MARPTKSAKVLTDGSQTLAEIETRIKNEDNLRGLADKIKPPTYLNSMQKRIFKYIVAQLEQSGILGNLDIYILTTCAIAIDRIQEIEKMINKDSDNLLNSGLMSAKDKYTKDFFRCTNELSLSPQSRAKIGNINLQANLNNADPLLSVLDRK